MPLTKNALIRYKTIDNCLRNRCKRWTLDMLVDACSEALYDYEGVGNISKRTVQLDLQMMRSDRYGYNAPIEVMNRSTTVTRTLTTPSPICRCRSGITR